MTDAAKQPQVIQTAGAQPARRLHWFPIVWVGMLIAICAVLFSIDVDPGIKHTVVLASIALAALGIAGWGCFFSQFSLRGRLLVVLLPLLLVVSYSPAGPIKLILDGDLGMVDWRWRWTAQPDEMLALPEAVGTIDQWEPTPNDYSRFLGSGYWAEVPGVELDTDWQAKPPKKLWQQEIGAGWSSFSIVGNYAVTQEQRGEQELVTCYEVLTGETVWTHEDRVRWDPTGGGALGHPGPRATPTIHESKVFAQGATGILNCLDARTGKLLWSHDTFKKHDALNVTWGKACSPLIVDDTVVASVGGSADQSLVAYRIDSGKVAWAAGKYQSSYASPVLTQLAGVRQIVTVDQGYVTAHDADQGEPLWEYAWPSDSGAAAAASQPIPLPGNHLFLSKGYGHGSALLKVSHDSRSGWQVAPAWKGVRQYGEKPVMKTKMSNVVVHQGYVYGLDEENLQCIELATGKKEWKKRRSPKIGYGQIMLVGDTLLIISEQGELILVEATHQKYRELASLRVFDESQITWNNPAFAPPYLLIRNAEEAACYELPLVAPGIRN